MTKRGRHRERSKRTEQNEQGTSFEWIPLWGWILLFLVPLLLSEFMFWNVRKIPSMIIFPVAWIGFWYTLMARSGWPILKNRKKEESSTSRDDG